MKLYRVAIYFLLGGLLLAPNFVLAQTDTSSPEIQVLNQQIAASKEKMKQLESTIGNLNKIIVAQETEGQSLKNQLSFLSNDILKIQADLDLTGEKLKQTQLEIDGLNLSIAAKQASLLRQQKMLAKMVQNIHVNDQKSYLEIAFTYNNFADYYDQLTQVRNLYVDIGRLAKETRIAKEQLATKKQTVESKKLSYVALQAELNNKKQSLSALSEHKKQLLIDSRGKESRYRTNLESLKQQYQIIVAEEQTFEAKVRKKLEAENKIQRGGEVPMVWPVPSRYINATFHDPGYPFRNVFQHSGIDIKASQGTPIHATASGYIARATHCSVSSCYNYVLLVHTGSISSLYGHLSQILVAPDQFVNKGEVIGYSGGTPGLVGSGPFVTGPHLHFEVRLNGIPVDPMPYLIQ